jgi:hypothetical protein
MEIHTPKSPIHGWREFLKEVSMIVLGVLIALGAELTVEALRIRGQVAEAQPVIPHELASNAASGVIRMRMSRCQDQRLNGIGRVLDETAATGRLEPELLLGRPRLLATLAAASTVSLHRKRRPPSTVTTFASLRPPPSRRITARHRSPGLWTRRTRSWRRA